jgi:hypothetical protein
MGAPNVDIISLDAFSADDGLSLGSMVTAFGLLTIQFAGHVKIPDNSNIHRKKMFQQQLQCYN